MENTELAVVEDILEVNPPGPGQALAPTEPSNLEPIPVPRKPFLCRHIFADGHRCGSPALRNENFCFYHYAHRTPTLAHRKRRRGDGFDLQRLDGLDNPTSIQLALSEVLGQIASNSVDPKRAGLLLYGLQIAGNNIRRSRPNENPIAEAIVEESHLGPVAEAEVGRALPPSELHLTKYLLAHPGTKLPENLEADTEERIRQYFAQ